jgi:hypothetical protein
MAAGNEERQGSEPVDEEKGIAATTVPKDEPGDEFPPFKKVVLIMIAVYLSMFLVALVICSSFSPATNSHVIRIGQLLEQQSQR